MASSFASSIALSSFNRLDYSFTSVYKESISAQPISALMCKYFLYAFIFSLSVWSACANSQTITAWSYYSSEPFQTDAKTNAGLAQDLVLYLNQALVGKRRLKLQLLPRIRLDQALMRGEKGIVLFAPSVIFGGIHGGHYLWSSALINDNQGFVSRTEKPFEYTESSSLHGVRFFAMRGHNFPLLQKEIDDGKILVERGDSERSLIYMLMAQRADVITIPDSVTLYFTARNFALKNSLYVSNKKLEHFSRHLMFQQGMEDEFQELEPLILKMNSDPKWVAILKKYGLEPSQKTARAR